MKSFIQRAAAGFIDYIKTDWASSKPRTIAEVYSWIASAVSGIIVSSTVPNPPWEVFYPLWLSALFCMMFCAYSRCSFGMLAFNFTLFLIDMTGYIRILMAKI